MDEDFEELLKRRIGIRVTLSELVDPIKRAVEAYAKSGDPDAVLGEEVGRAANRLTAALAGSPETIPPETLLVLASLRWVQHSSREGTVSGVLDREEAIRLYEQVLAERPELPRETIPNLVLDVLDKPDPDVRRLVAAHDGAVELLKEGHRRKDRVRLREGIEILRRAIRGSRLEASELAQAWLTLSIAWQWWHEMTGQAVALDEAIEARRRSAEDLPPGATRANQYQELYALLHQRQGLLEAEPSATDEAIAALRMALDALASDAERPAQWLMRLARDLVDQAERTGTGQPAEEALDILRHRVAAASDVAELEPSDRLLLLADAYVQKGRLSGDPTAYQAARTARAAAGATSAAAASEPSGPCACTRPARERLLPLSRDLSYGFGLIVLDVDVEDVEDLTGPQPETITIGPDLPKPDEAAFQWDYAAFRSVQTMASAFLNRHALRLLDAGVEVIRRVGGSSGWEEVSSRFAREATRLSRPGPEGLSCIDLLESSARLEAYRQFLSGFGVAGRRTTVGLYLSLEKAAHPDPDAPERHGFTYLADLLGEDDAYELMAPLTFLAFTAEEPVDVFTTLAARAVGRADELTELTGEELLAWAGLADQYWQGYIQLIAMGVPLGTSFITDPLRAALEIWDRSSLLNAFCRPSRYLSTLPGDQRTFRHLLAPVIVLKTRAGELTVRVNGLAESRPGYSYDVIRHAGLVAAAERLTVLRDQPVEHRCWHHACPAFDAGLCHRWYAVPSTEDGHDACGFHREFAGVAGLPASEAWHAARNRG